MIIECNDRKFEEGMANLSKEDREFFENLSKEANQKLKEDPSFDVVEFIYDKLGIPYIKKVRECDEIDNSEDQWFYDPFDEGERTMKKIKTWADYKKMRELNYKFLDTLDLPTPEFGEDLKDYVERVESMFEGIELPYELNYIFEYADDQEELGKYLADRFGMNCMEDVTIKYIMY